MKQKEFEDLAEGIARHVDGIKIITVYDWDIYAEVHGTRVVFGMMGEDRDVLYCAQREAKPVCDEDEKIKKANFQMIMDLEKLRVWFERNVFPDTPMKMDKYSLATKFERAEVFT